MEKNKNIWVIPTDKPSRLIFNKSHQSFCLQKEPEGMYINDGKVSGADFWGIEKANNNGFNPQHIYITNDEEIKKGNWVLFMFDEVKEIVKVTTIVNNAFDSKEGFGYGLEYCKKIILTTDEALIKDGVQAVDDEFLEWFVKNPSCEFVKIREKGNVHATVKGRGIKSFKNGYKIIIPKKNFYCGDKFDYDEQCLEQCDTCVDKKGVDYGYLPKEEPKKVLTEEDIFNQKDIDAVTDYINKEQQKQALIDMMKSDEELGLYDDIEINRIELVCKDCSYSLEDCACIKSTIDFPKQEIKLEEVFNDEKKENIKKFIDEIQNPSEPNQALKDAAQRYEKYSERFDNKDNEIVEGIFNPDNWGRRLVKEKPKQETLEEAAREYYKRGQLGFEKASDTERAFLNGAKWQQERMYSEDDMKKAFSSSSLTNMLDVYDSFEEFMEQLKKK